LVQPVQAVRVPARNGLFKATIFSILKYYKYYLSKLNNSNYSINAIS
jgi:hypothetical protein